MAKYRRFPYRTFFRWFFLFFFLLMILCAPLFVYVVGDSMERWLEDGLNQSPSIRNEPGKAEEVTYDWHSYWPQTFWFCLVVFIVYLGIFRWARPARDPKVSSYG